MRLITRFTVFFTLLPFIASAQQALTGTITGTITDASEAAVPNAQITARNVDTGLERTATSGEIGLYTLTLLPLGEYEVTAKKAGFADAKVGSVRVGVGQSITVELRMAVGTAATQVQVESGAAAVETTRSSVSNSVDNSQIANLGVNGRDFLKFLLLTPGVTQDVRTGDLSFGGLRGTLNSVQVDGTDNNNNFYGQTVGRTGTGRAPYQFSVDSVEEFQINSSSYSAEFGRAGGAVTNVVTKSGTNEFHGSAFEYFRDREMNANTWINNSRGIPIQPYHINQFGGTVGGPVVKNKDFFFFNYDGQRRHLPNPVFLGVPIPAALAADPANQSKIQALTGKLNPYQLAYDQDVYLVKNDWQINDRHRLSGRYNRQRFNGVGLESSGNQVAYEHSGTASVYTDTVALSLASVFTPTLINEFRFEYLQDNEPSVAYSSGPETVLRDSGVTALSFGASSITPRFANIKGEEFADNLTHIMGRHTFKVGADVNHNGIENYFAGNVRGSYTFNSYADYFASNPASFIQAFPGPNTPGFTTKPNFTELGFYAQDEFHPSPKLTLNFGLRYDLALLTKPPVKNPDPQLASFGLDTSSLNNDTNNIGPRFGFAYKPLSSDKLVVRGGYGMFFGRTPQILVSTAYNQNGISASSLTFTGAAIPPYPSNFSAQPSSGGTAAVPSILLFDPTYVLPLVFQGSLGIEYEVARNTTISLSYLNVRGEHLTRTRDVNLFPPVPVSVTLPGLGNRTLLRYPGPQGSPFRPMNHFARVEVFESGANSFYNGMTLSFKRRFSKHYQVNLAYTYAKAIDDVTDFTSVVPFNSIDEIKMPQYPTLPALDRGPSVNDQRHRVITNFVWNLDYLHGMKSPARYLVDGWTLSGVILAQTGQPFSNAVGGDAVNDTNSQTSRVPQDGRNTNYAPTISNWDLRVTKAIPLYRERVQFQLALDAFNAFNEAEFLASNIRNAKFNLVTATGAFVPTTNFGTYANQTLDNRILQVSGKIVF